MHGQVAAQSGTSTSDLPAASGVVADVTPAQLADPAGAARSRRDARTRACRSHDASFAERAGAGRGVPADDRRIAVVGRTASMARATVVAVLDTGIDRLPDFGKRLVGGVDLSGEGNAFQDSYGHGTFVAGLIAGNGASSKGLYTGEAPGANLVSVKVAGASGVTDLATVISGINWVVPTATNTASTCSTSRSVRSRRRRPCSTRSTRPSRRAWQAGITVVASAGNAGPFNGTIVSPGDDPLVITVGALDDNGSTNPAAATATTFSSVGPTNIDGWFKPDLVTSGRSVVSLRAPGSTIDTPYPSARDRLVQLRRLGHVVQHGDHQRRRRARGPGCADRHEARTSARTATTRAHTERDQGAAARDGTRRVRSVTRWSTATARSTSSTRCSHPGLELTQIAPTVPLRSTAVDLGTTCGSSWNGSNWNGAGTGRAGTGRRGTGLWNGVELERVVLERVELERVELERLELERVELERLFVERVVWNGSSWNGSSWNGSSWNGSIVERLFLERVELERLFVERFELELSAGSLRLPLASATVRPTRRGSIP